MILDLTLTHMLIGSITDLLGLLPNVSGLHLPTYSTAGDGLAQLALAATQKVAGTETTSAMLQPITTPIATPLTPHRSIAIPPKLLKRIWDLEFIEMSELLPESWEIEATQQTCCQATRRPSRRAPVTDILIWVECFSTFVAVISVKFPGSVPDMMAYQKSIVRASRNFEGTAWAVYDRCYRRRAAASKDLRWSVPDSALYNEAFTGRARAIPRCHHCLSENHMMSMCPDLPYELRNQWQRQPQPRWPSSFTAQPTFAGARPQEPCRLYNQGRCRVRRCKYLHYCTSCGAQDHPQISCPNQVARGYRDRSLPPTPGFKAPAIPRPPIA